MITMTAVLRQVPPDHTGEHALERTTHTESADDYATAYDAVHAQVPAGWQIIAVLVDRP